MSTVPHLAARQGAVWRGISGEVVRIGRQQPFELAYSGPWHLLIAYRFGMRSKGESVVDELPPSTVHDLGSKLTFVPADSRFRERHEPGGPLEFTCLYVDPDGPLMDSSTLNLAPQMHFQNRALWETAHKLTHLIETGRSAPVAYAEALGAVLFEELLLLGQGKLVKAPAVKGGLADWQQRVSTEYIERNLDQDICITTLAEIVRLSRYHYSRAFKKCFGTTPHRYHLSRRIDLAKTLLADPSHSVTEVALEVGFANPSSFSVAFRKLVGRSPSGYRRTLF